MPKVHAKERLYLNSDRTKVVKEGDKESAFLLCGKGQAIPEKYLHLIEKKKVKVEESDGEETSASDPIEERSTRVPSKISKRNRY